MKVAIHAFEGMSMFHLAVPQVVFGELQHVDDQPNWDLHLWSENAQPIRTREGARLDQLLGPPEVADADLMIFPSWHEDLRPASTALIHWIREAHQNGARIAGLCLGAFPVVDTGLLDSRSAVTHWAAAAQLAARRACVQVNADAIYLDHGDVLTSAGTASAIDACLHILRVALGADTASTVARRLVVAPHREGGQLQYVDRPVPAHNGVGALGGTMDWALSNLHRPLSVDDLATHAGMSRRNFTRRFIESTGTSPAKWIIGRRLDESRRLLEKSELPIEHIARACGFNSAVTFRQRFMAAFGTTPSSYRQRFTS